MIRKIASIQNMAVFSDFNWDNSVKDPAGTIQCFKQVNVMYGRNYSGKTTLSRIMRAFETGSLSDKYGTPSFSLEADDKLFTEADYSSKPFLIRVFNEDFIRENLRFVIDPNDVIAPFAILGEDNDRIEQQIEQIQAILGTNEPGSETGLYHKRVLALKTYNDVKTAHSKAESDLTKKKNSKATGREGGIKYRSDRFGNQNYTIRNLETDIKAILSLEYSRPSDEQLLGYEKSIKETAMESPKTLSAIELSIAILAARVKEICTRKVGQSQKINELLSDIALQEWVHQGLEINNGRSHCAFCGSPLTDARWKKLFSHFDEESEQLRGDIENCLNELVTEESRLKNGFLADRTEFYSSFVADVDSLVEKYAAFSDEYMEAISTLRLLLNARKDSIHSPIVYLFESPNLNVYSKLIAEYADLRKKHIDYSSSMATTRRKAQEQLRLAEVDTFVNTIGYSDCVNNIEQLSSEESKAKDALDAVEGEIKEKLLQIDHLKRQQNDEEKGAIKVNELLQLYFGHRYLSIISKKQNEENAKSIYFEVVRNGEKAFHLSEGEKSLIAFCYFVAKLKDIETDGKKPIIWIDDPISSLDENHIYYVYSLITQEILKHDGYDQLFITTHNLLFLKYLRKLDINKHSKSEKGVSRSDFLIERRGNESTIVVMPAYLKKHGTEFNRWFENIYYCAVANSVTDENLYLFESFGNNTRKFLETYLYYRYPDKKEFDEHLQRFFGEEVIPPLLVRKLSDERSHAQGDLENHALPFDEPEITDAAKAVLKRLKDIDNDQYDALMSYIKQD